MKKIQSKGYNNLKKAQWIGGTGSEMFDDDSHPNDFPPEEGPFDDGMPNDEYWDHAELTLMIKAQEMANASGKPAYVISIESGSPGDRKQFAVEESYLNTDEYEAFDGQILEMMEPEE